MRVVHPLQALADIQAMRAADPKRTVQSMAGELGVSRARVANLVRVLGLPDPVLGWVWSGKLTPKHGETLAGLPASRAEALARASMAGGWSSKRLHEEVSAAKGHRSSQAPNQDVDLARLESRLGEHLGTRVRLDHRATGAGELVLCYTDLNTLDGLLDRLGYQSEE